MFLFSLSFSAQATTLAITEFLNDTNGDEATDEWIEIYNYGNQAVDTTGWIIADEGMDSDTLPSALIPPKAFAILTEDPVAFVNNWGVGNVGVNVLLIAGGSLGNGADELALIDQNNNIRWSLAYDDDDSTGFATNLFDTGFQIDRHGDSALPGVVRNGDDNGIQGYLGYEDTFRTPDPFAFLSMTGDLGSPLDGDYTGGGSLNPILTLTGQCPGIITISASDLTPQGNLTVLTGSAPGNVAIPVGPCAGTDSGLGAGIVVRANPSADIQGNLIISPAIPAGLCGELITVLDEDSCRMSNVEQF